MVTVTSLWLPILLSAVFVFVASSVMHMVLTYHKKDYSQLPNEGVLDALRSAPPGQYMFPWAGSMKEAGSAAMIEKQKRGPVGVLTLRNPGVIGMGAALTQWFLFSIVVGIFVAYVCTRTVAAGADYLGVFRLAGTVAFLGYAGNEVTRSIWGWQPWGTTVRNTLDGLVYALLTAGVFGWLWPR